MQKFLRELKELERLIENEEHGVYVFIAYYKSKKGEDELLPKADGEKMRVVKKSGMLYMPNYWTVLRHAQAGNLDEAKVELEKAKQYAQRFLSFGYGVERFTKILSVINNLLGMLKYAI